MLPGVTASRSRGWVDAIAGVRGKTHLTPKFFVTGEADLGGGGSNLTYHLFSGGGFLVGRRYALIAAYRYLDVNYNKDSFSSTWPCRANCLVSQSSSNQTGI